MHIAGQQQLRQLVADGLLNQSAQRAGAVDRVEPALGQPLLGLGPLSIVSLAQARDRAKAARRQLLDNLDPLEQRKAAKAAAALEAARTKTFKQCAEEFFKDNQSGWRSAAHARQYFRSIEHHAFPTLGALSVAAIGTGEVMRVIKPLWERIPVTAGRRTAAW